VIALLIGLAVAAVASAPALLFAWGSREVTDFKQTSIARVPVIIGVAIGYVIFYTLESMVTLRAKK
jgi:hypothetical protein